MTFTLTLILSVNVRNVAEVKTLLHAKSGAASVNDDGDMADMRFSGFSTAAVE